MTQLRAPLEIARDLCRLTAAAPCRSAGDDPCSLSEEEWQRWLAARDRLLAELFAEPIPEEHCAPLLSVLGEVQAAEERARRSLTSQLEILAARLARLRTAARASAAYRGRRGRNGASGRQDGHG